VTARIVYVLLSPTFGMHQYTADLANRIADSGLPIADLPGTTRNTPGTRFLQPEMSRPPVSLITTTTLPRNRYSAAVRIETPVTIHGTGFARESLDLRGCRRVLETITQRPSATADQPSSIVHFTGVHAWNVPLVYALRRRGIPMIHTLHDLHPHGGVRHGRLIGLWNRLIIGSGTHLLVHGRRYREELISRGVAPKRITYAPLLHGFWGYGKEQGDGGVGSGSQIAHGKMKTVLFFGRVEQYKGVDVLLAAWERVQGDKPEARLVIAGPAADGAIDRIATHGEIERRDRLIEDDEAIELFWAASLLVLPYRNATQSALIAAAYAFGVPVVVTATGALPEYVVEGETGWIVPPGESAPLANVLRTALADPVRLKAMGQAGRAWFEEQRRQEEAALVAMYEGTCGRPT
jgi:alpha-maltose-1-phosphate synthase